MRGCISSKCPPPHGFHPTSLVTFPSYSHTCQWQSARARSTPNAGVWSPWQNATPMDDLFRIVTAIRFCSACPPAGVKVLQALRSGSKAALKMLPGPGSKLFAQGYCLEAEHKFLSHCNKMMLTLIHLLTAQTQFCIQTLDMTILSGKNNNYYHVVDDIPKRGQYSCARIGPESMVGSTVNPSAERAC